MWGLRPVAHLRGRNILPACAGRDKPWLLLSPPLLLGIARRRAVARCGQTEARAVPLPTLAVAEPLQARPLQSMAARLFQTGRGTRLSSPATLAVHGSPAPCSRGWGEGYWSEVKADPAGSKPP